MISRERLMARVTDLLRRTGVDDADELIGELSKRVIADVPPRVLTAPWPKDVGDAPPVEYCFDAAPNFPIRVPPGTYGALRIEPRRNVARIVLIGNADPHRSDCSCADCRMLKPACPFAHEHATAAPGAECPSCGARTVNEE